MKHEKAVRINRSLICLLLFFIALHSSSRSQVVREGAMVAAFFTTVFGLLLVQQPKE